MNAAPWPVACPILPARRGGALSITTGGASCRHAAHWLAVACGSTSITRAVRSEEHTSELQSLMRHSYAVFRSQKSITTESDEERQYGTEHHSTPDAQNC